MDFISYYRANKKNLDHVYFVRQEIDLSKPPESFTLIVDKTHSTNYDYKLAKVLANDLLEAYLREQLGVIELGMSFEPARPIIPKLTWTGSKAALIELIYAIQVSGTLDHGRADIKRIATFCEQALDIKLGDCYKAFQEIRSRKTGRTKFLDSMREQLIKKMDMQDEVGG